MIPKSMHFDYPSVLPLHLLYAPQADGENKPTGAYRPNFPS